MEAFRLPTRKAMADAIMTEMLGMRGEGRYNDPALVTRILGSMGLPYALDGDPVAFCASTLCFCAMKFLAVKNEETLTEENGVSILRKYRSLVDAHYFGTSASVAEMVAKNQPLWLPSTQVGDDTAVLPGWAICYRWDNDEHHIGIVVEDQGDTLQTIEGNTSDGRGHTGMIARKSRDWENIWGFLKFYTP